MRAAAAASVFLCSSNAASMFGGRLARKQLDNKQQYALVDLRHKWEKIYDARWTDPNAFRPSFLMRLFEN
jgi:hypothetical protein